MSAKQATYNVPAKYMEDRLSTGSRPVAREKDKTWPVTFYDAGDVNHTTSQGRAKSVTLDHKGSLHSLTFIDALFLI